MNDSHKLNKNKKRLKKLVKNLVSMGADRREKCQNRIKELERFVAENK